MSDIRVLVVDDDDQVAQAIEATLRHADGFAVAGVAMGVTEALEAVATSQPDVVLLDVEMPEGGGPRLARELQAAYPQLKVLAHSAWQDERHVTQMLAAGAVGYIVKDGNVHNLLGAVARASSGQATFSDEVANAIARGIKGNAAESEWISETEVAAAFGSGLSVVFQPILDMNTRVTVAAEALARFSVEPLRGPDFWFAAADRSGGLVEAEISAIRKAQDVSRRLPGALRIAFNVSPMTVMSGRIGEAFEGFPMSRVILEVTERAPIDDYQEFARMLAPARQAGAQVAVDDVGSGFASLRHILRLQPDMIKLDRDLCAGINLDAARLALASGLTSFAFGIGASIVAEGIETRAEVDVLTALGVGLGQGYLLGRPQTAGSDWPAPGIN